MSELESEFIDAMEFTGETEVVQNEQASEAFTKEFSPKQIGSIAKYIEPTERQQSILLQIFLPQIRTSMRFQLKNMTVLLVS